MTCWSSSTRYDLATRLCRGTYHQLERCLSEYETARHSRRPGIGPEAVVADLGLDPGRLGAPANHLVGVGLGQGTAGELARAAADSAKQRPLEVCRKPGPVQIGREDLLKVCLLYTSRCV